MNLTLPLTAKWFNLTAECTKTEDYREITPYWCKRLLQSDYHAIDRNVALRYLIKHLNQPIKLKLKDADACVARHGFQFKTFNFNIMQLGYPKKGDNKRRIYLEHLGIEIRTGNSAWGAEPNKLYFVILHGELCASH